MKLKNEKLLDDLIGYTIQPVLYDDCQYGNEEEFDSLKRYLIDLIQEIEYVEQYEDDEIEED